MHGRTVHRSEIHCDANNDQQDGLLGAERAGRCDLRVPSMIRLVAENDSHLRDTQLAADPNGRRRALRRTGKRAMFAADPLRHGLGELHQFGQYAGLARKQRHYQTGYERHVQRINGELRIDATVLACASGQGHRLGRLALCEPERVSGAQVAQTN